MKPRLLDLFCGAGGCSVGYARAGFEVVGVDVAPQPNYPFRFVQADALTVLEALNHCHYKDLSRRDFAAAHASPPCQHFTRYNHSVKDLKERYEDLLAPTRDLLREMRMPYVIENVEGAPMLDPVTICGSMFDLDVQRHRLFETNWDLQPPPWPCRHKIWGPNRYPGGRWKARREKDGVTKPSTPVRNSMEVGRWNVPLEDQKRAMGVDWGITLRELSESIPPAYTEFIGEQLISLVGAAR